MRSLRHQSLHLLRHVLRHPLCPGCLLAMLAIIHPWLEATMARHMVLEIPAIFACGWLAAHAAGPRLSTLFSHWGFNGIPALLASLLVTGYWMLPVALDHAVLDPSVNILKVISLILAGLITGTTWRQAGTVLQAFFVLNWAWMTLTAGLLYQEAPQQLCSVYLSEQQALAGAGMVALASALLALWLLNAVILPGIVEEAE